MWRKYLHSRARYKVLPACERGTCLCGDPLAARHVSVEQEEFIASFWHVAEHARGVAMTLGSCEPLSP